MNTPYPPLPSHTIIPIDADTLLLVVETRVRPHYAPGKHAYMRFPNFSPGETLILGVSPNSLCEVLKVRQNQAFRTASWKDGNKTLVTCTVTSDLSFRLLDQDEDANGSQSLETDLFLDDQLLNPPINDEELILLFSAQWPDWLQPSLTAQLRYWQLHNVDLYFRFSPWPVDRSDLWKCVKAAPQEALRRFAPLLDGRQKNICFEKAPDAAVKFAFAYLSSPLRRRAISSYPDEVTIRHSKSLDDSEVREIALRHPRTVFRFFQMMESRQRALALALAIKSSKIDIVEVKTLTAYVLIDSLAKHPDLWIEIFGCDRSSIIPLLESRTKIPFNGKFILEIHDQLAPEHQMSLRRIIAEYV